MNMTELLILKIWERIRMLSIAICDDNTATTTAIENMLYKMGDAQNIRLNCDVFLMVLLCFSISVRASAMI